MSYRYQYNDSSLFISPSLYGSSKPSTHGLSTKNNLSQFDKFSSQVYDPNGSQRTNYTTSMDSFQGIKKLPHSISSIRQTFSYNQNSSPKKHINEGHTEKLKEYKRKRIASGYDLLRQTLDIASINKKDNYQLGRTVSNYSIFDEPSHVQSLTNLSDHFNAESRNYKQSEKYLAKFSHSKPTSALTSREYTKPSYRIQDQLKTYRQQNTHDLKKYNHPLSSSVSVQNSYLSETVDLRLKSNSYFPSRKNRDNFAKKNFVDYYTPKVQKTTYQDKFDFENSCLSPQFKKISKQKRFHIEFPEDSLKIKIIKENSLTQKGIQKDTDIKRKVTINDFIIVKNLGQGKFGTVQMVYHQKTGAIFAMKKVKKDTIKKNSLIQQFILEVKLQSFLFHPFILKIYSLFSDTQHIYIILEYMQEGSLYTYFKAHRPLSQSDVAQKIRYLAQTIKYIQDRGIVHRDIKPENIIMHSNVCKLADFGWATLYDQERRKTYCGTCDYVAPQILSGQGHDQTVDLWCMGVLAYEMAAGKAPFYHMSIKETRKKILNVNLTFPEHFSSELRSFVSKLIKKDSSKRMTIQQALQHPFIKNIKLYQ